MRPRRSFFSMLSKPSLEYTFSIRSRTSSGAPACLNSSLGFSGSRSPSAHWPSFRAFAGRAVVIEKISFATFQAWRRSSPAFIGGAEIRRHPGHVGGGSTKSRQTATAADTLGIDMPPRHQGYLQVGAGDGHGAIVP